MEAQRLQRGLALALFEEDGRYFASTAKARHPVSGAFSRPPALVVALPSAR